MKKDNNIDFIVTEESINLINEIISKMENKTFHNHYHIIYDICSSIQKEDVSYMEIGAYAGGSASLMSKHKKVKKILSLDIGRPISKEITINNVNRFKHDKCLYEYVEGDSSQKHIIDLVKSKINDVDILFIDGDHSYGMVIKDFNNYKDLVSKNGFIIFDDYLDSIHSPDVFRAVNDIVKDLNTEEYQIIGSIEYDLISKTNVPNFKSSNEFIIKKL